MRLGSEADMVGGWPRRLARLLMLALLLALALLLCGLARAAPARDAAQRSRLEMPASPSHTAGSAPGSVQFIGTATVIIRFQSFTILTDPNFFDQGQPAHLGHRWHATRQTAPAVQLEALPSIDLIVLSHFHEDHFDRLVKQKLDRAIPIVSTRQVAVKLGQLGFKRLYPLATWEVLEVQKGAASLRLTAMPGRHGPLLAAPPLSSVMGAMLDFGARLERHDGKNGAGAHPIATGARPSYRLYISGDSMVHDDIADIPERFPGVDLALLHLGGTRLLGVLKATRDADDGLRMLKIIAPEHAIPAHYHDYEVFKSPPSTFEQAVNQAGLAGKISYLKHGEAYSFTPKMR